MCKGKIGKLFETAKDLRAALDKFIEELQQAGEPKNSDDEFWADIFPKESWWVNSDGNILNGGGIQNLGFDVTSQKEAEASKKRNILLAVAFKLNGCSQDELDYNIELSTIMCVHGRIEVVSYVSLRFFGTVWFKSKELALEAIRLCEARYGKDFFKP